MEMKIINLKRAEFKDIPNTTRENMMMEASPFCKHFNSKWYSAIWPPHSCSISDTLGHDPNKTMHGVLGDLVPDVDQGITKLPSSLRCNLMDELEDVGPSGHSQEVCF